MKKYYIVTPESKVHEEYMAYEKQRPVTNAIIRDFAKEQGIEADGYYVNNQSFYIVPTTKDEGTFGTMMVSKAEDNGLRRFKANSKVGKAWVKNLKDKNHKVISKPMLAFYFSVCGHSWSQILEIAGTVYASYEVKNMDFENPKGFQEIKASEYHKIIEDEIERRKQEGASGE